VVRTHGEVEYASAIGEGKQRGNHDGMGMRGSEELDAVREM